MSLPLSSALPSSTVLDPRLAASLEAEEVPEQFLCPITRCLMRNPVISPLGHTFERQAIRTWISSNHSDPISRTRLDPGQLAPNRAIAELIDDLIKKKPQLRDLLFQDGSGTGIEPRVVPLVPSAPTLSEVTSVLRANSTSYRIPPRKLLLNVSQTIRRIHEAFDRDHVGTVYNCPGQIGLSIRATIEQLFRTMNFPAQVSEFFENEFSVTILCPIEAQENISKLLEQLELEIYRSERIGLPIISALRMTNQTQRNSSCTIL